MFINWRGRIHILQILFLCFATATSVAQDSTKQSQLKKLTVEELMNLEVTSVSRNRQRLTEVASAVQVINRDDIRRSGATSVAEALRLAANLVVAKSNSNSWAISARGFNSGLGETPLSNKLLVLIDGRTVYTPLYGGVYWDVQQVLLEDIDRIEVISGPGGSIWGANAMNGVINIITKPASETVNLYASASVGTHLRHLLAARYGIRIDSAVYLRIYGRSLSKGDTELPGDVDAKDSWYINQGGFRLDMNSSARNSFKFQGDYYDGRMNRSTGMKYNGQNIQGRWRHSFSNNSVFTVRGYIDRVFREYSSISDDEMITFNGEISHRYTFRKRHQLFYGIEGQLIRDNATFLPFQPLIRNIHLYNAFIQDQVQLSDKFELTLGSKFLHNEYSGFEFQPTARLSYLLKSQTVWVAASRAVRTPSRYDADITTPFIMSDNNFKSETVVAWEAGYRVNFASKHTISIATFYNQYDQLRGFDSLPGEFVYTITNNQEATSWGVELSANIWVSDIWRLRAGFTYFDAEFSNLTPTVVTGSDMIEGVDPSQHAMLQSILNLPGNFELDVIAFYVDDIPQSRVSVFVPEYFTADVRIAWHYKQFEIAVLGRNLPEEHQEFGNNLIPTNFYGKLTCRF